MLPQISKLRLELKKVDIILLVFLVLLLNVKLLVKLLAIGFILVARPGFSFSNSKSQPGLPIFIPVIITIAIFNLIFSGLWGREHYWLVFLSGLGIWMICFILSTHAKKFANRNSPENLHNTLVAFFIINSLVSLAMLISIIFETGSINPYTYQGNYQKYFIGTGDYIKGISFDTSTTNAAVNAFGIFYFLHKSSWWLLILCIVCLLLTGSNLVNFLVLCCLAFQFIFRSNREQKSVIVLCLLPMIIFWARISPQNNQYVSKAFNRLLGKETAEVFIKEVPLIEKPDSILNQEEKKQKFATLYLDRIGRSLMKKAGPDKPATVSTALLAAEEKPLIPTDNIHAPEFQHKDNKERIPEQWIQFANTSSVQASAVTDKKLPGKITAFRQTIDFLAAHPQYIAMGKGMGNYSSRLAFKASALNIAGYYPAKFAYTDADFKREHLALYLAYFTGSEGLHSVINIPNSVADQMLGEYGIAGILAFLFLYLGFFARRSGKLSYGVPILLIMTGLFFTEYWFEQLSIVFLFELFLFMDLKNARNAA